MSLPENSYGISKRLQFVAGAIACVTPRRVLDIGCGTGTYLTAPLAQQFPDIQFIGVDSDAVSIEYARREFPLPNTRFLLAGELDAETFDLVIASEVIEHVEDPPAFLGFLADHLSPSGCLVLTLPNGYGLFELASFLETLLSASGIMWLLRAVKRVLIPARPTENEAPRDSHAISPHVNFFSFGEIRGLINSAGFRIMRFKPRTLLCGFGLDFIVRGEHMVRWNATVTDRLPACCASDWMFLLEPAGAPTPQAYQRGRYARLRRALNEKRWGLR